MTVPSRPRRLRPTRLAGAGVVLLVLLEIVVIGLVSSWIGGWWTFALLVGTSLLGAWLIAREGGRAWRALGQALAEGRMPARELADGIIVLVGGLLLLLPGFITDLAGLLLVLPFTRPVARTLLAGAISSHVVARVDFYAEELSVTGGPEAPPEGPRRSAASTEVVEGEVIEGHVVDDDRRDDDPPDARGR